ARQGAQERDARRRGRAPRVLRSARAGLGDERQGLRGLARAGRAARPKDPAPAARRRARQRRAARPARLPRRAHVARREAAAHLPQLDPGELDWTIPAWHREKIAALLEGLSRAQRRELGSIPELSDRLARELRPFSGPLVPALVRAVQAATGVALPPEAIRLDALPAYLRLMIRVIGERGKP